MTAVWSVLRGWFGGLPWGLIAGLAVPALALGLEFAVYKAGQASARAGEMQALAADNARAAGLYQKQVIAVNAAMDLEQGRAERLAADNARLKERVDAVAKGNASPGVELAVRGQSFNGVQYARPKTGSAGLSRP